MLHAHHGILLKNKKEQNINTRNNLDEFPGNSCWVKNANPQKLHNILFNLYSIFKWQNYWNREQMNGWQVEMKGAAREVGGYKKSTWRILVVIELLSTLTVVKNTQTFTNDRTKYTYTHIYEFNQNRGNLNKMSVLSISWLWYTAVLQICGGEWKLGKVCLGFLCIL